MLLQDWGFRDRELPPTEATATLNKRPDRHAATSLHFRSCDYRRINDGLSDIAVRRAVDLRRVFRPDRSLWLVAARFRWW